MRHNEATERLAELVEGGLEDAAKAELEGHIADCPDCRGWLETYALVAMTRPSAPESRWDEHPPSETLARYAVGNGRLEPFELRRLQNHLQGCRECALAVEQGRAAAEAEDSPVAAYGPPERGWMRRVGRSRLAIAASLLLALTISFFFRGRTGGDRRISGESLSGSQVVTARHSISASDTEIGVGAEVTFKAGEVVMLGDGFSVASGAVFSVELDGAEGVRRR